MRKIILGILLIMLITLVTAYGPNGNNNPMDKPGFGPGPCDADQNCEPQLNCLDNNCDMMPKMQMDKNKPFPKLNQIREKIKENFREKVNARKDMIMAKKDIMDAKNRYQDAKRELLQLKANNSIRIMLGTEKGIDLSKRFLEHHLTNAIIKLEKIRTHIENHPVYEDKNEALDQIDEYLLILDEMKSEIPDLNDTNSIMNMVSEIKKIWNEAQTLMSVNSANLISDKIESSLTKFDDALTKTESQISELKSAGKDVNELETSFEKIQDNYADAKQTLEEAQDYFKDADNSEDLAKGRELLNEGLQKIRAVHQDLRALINSVMRLSKE